jgi:competence protein ComEA
MKRPYSIKFTDRLTLAAIVIFTAICTTASIAQTSGTPTSGASKDGAQVDINTADLRTLETLPGVGPATAQKIIENRPYRSMADLGKVKGLNEAKLNDLKDRVTFGQTTMAAPAGSAPATPKQRQPSISTTSNRSGAEKVSPPRSSAKVTPGEKININTANVTDLDRLPGIGPAKAQAIIDYRTQNGNFKSIEDIQKVKGIKGGEFAKVKDHIKVSN